MQNIELIANDELSEIRRIWLEEFHEFDDVLPNIYCEVTGQIFIDPRPNAGNDRLGLDEWSVLEEICEDPMHFELITRLLSTERKFQTMSRRVGIIDALEKHFDTSSRAKDEAIDNAHLNWNIKKAAKEGDVEAVKQLTVSAASLQENQPAPSWADLKFKGRS
jgi:DNA sulfur modification protein DndC